MGKCCCLVFIAVVALTVAGVSIGVPLAMRNVKEKFPTFGEDDVNNACQATAYPTTCNQSLTEGNFSADTYGVSRHSLRTAEAGVQFTLQLVLLLNTTTNGSITTAIDVCVECLTLAREELDAAVSLLQSSDTTARRRALDDLKACVSAAMELHTTCIDSIIEISRSDGLRLQQISSHSDELLSNALAILNALAMYGENSSLWRPTEFSLPDGLNPSLAPSLPRIPGHHHRKLLSAAPDGHPSTPDWMDVQTRRHLLNYPTYDVVVAQDGSGNFTTIQEAVNAFRKSSSRRVIYIRAGVYKEQVIVPKTAKFLTFFGDGSKTVITGSRNVALEQGMTTYRTATLIVFGKGFIGRSFKVENTAGSFGHQAVAFRGTADKIVMYQVTFDGYQDTLYAHSFRQYYRECTIYGTVDFVFGNAAACFQSCQFIAKLTTLPGQRNTYTAQGRTDAHQNTGFSFQNCIFDGTDDLKSHAALHKSYLGRPWKKFSVCVIMKSEVRDHIDSQGWLPWNTTSFGLNTSFFAEFDNFGPGSGTANRVPWSHQIWSTITALQYHASSFVQAKQWVADHNIPLTTTL